MLDEGGGSKGFGFIRFGNETEQQTALTTMQGIAGLGGKPIKVSIAVQKAKDHSSHPTMEFPMGLTQTIQKQLTGQYNGGAAAAAPTPGGDYGYYNQYNQYWSNMAAWQQYQGYYQGYPQQEGGAVNPPLPPNPFGEQPPTGEQGEQEQAEQDYHMQEEPASIFDGALNEPVEHNKPLNYHALNSLFARKTEEVWLEMEGTGWWERD